MTGTGGGPIVGIGVDVVEVSRFAATLDRVPRLKDRLFAPSERGLPPAGLAARFAAKEAVAKALGAPAGMSWLEVTVARQSGEAPTLQVTGGVAARAAELGVTRFHLSLSHDGDLACAMVVAERAQAAPR